MSLVFVGIRPGNNRGCFDQPLVVLCTCFLLIDFKTAYLEHPFQVDAALIRD